MSKSAPADALDGKGSSNGKPGITAVLVPVLLSTLLALGAVAGGVYWLLRSGKLNGGPAAAAPARVEAVVPVKPAPSHVLALEPMVVNLADAGGRAYLRAAISLRIRDEEKAAAKEEAPKDPKAVDGAAAALRDTTLSVLSSESADSLLEKEGRESLKKKLGEQYKLRNAETPVLEIYFTEFLVQR